MDAEPIVAGHRPDDGTVMPDPCWEPGPAHPAIDAVAAAIDDLLAADLTAAGSAATLDLLRAVETQTRRLYAMSVAVIGEMDRRGLAAPAGKLSTASLVRQVITIGRGDAAARVRLSAAATATTGLSGAPIPPRLPVLAAALQAGTIGPRHADLAVSVFKSFDPSVSTELRDSVEQFLVTEAARTDPVTFDNVCRRIILAANPDGPEEEQDAHDKQEFHIGARRPNGLTKVWGLLDDITVESLRVVFGAMCAPAAGRNKCDTPDPDPARTESGGDGENDSHGGGDGHDGKRSDGGSDGDSDEGFAFPTDDEDSPTDTPGTAAPDDQQPDKNPVDDGRVDDGADETPAEDPATDSTHCTGATIDNTDGAGESGAVATGVDPPPIWRAPRVPYEWASLGTLPGDYPHPTPHPPGGGGGKPYPELKPRLFGDDGCPEEDPGRQPDPAGRPRAATRRAQALGVIVAKFLDAGHAPIQGGERPHLLVTVEERSLRDRLGHGTLGYGTHISNKTVRMLACDSKVIAAVLGGQSELLDMGRSMRAFNAATTRAILLRDKGCIFPGCDMPGLWTERHHIQPWQEGGPSDYSNGCLLCRRHHTLVHHSDWTVRMAADGHPEIIPPATHDPERKPIRNSLNHPPEFDWPQPGPSRVRR